MTEDTPRLIAFYLPQYHPIPENDRFWGEGFTEWHHVAAARPRYPGHPQPRLPGELGFYDLRSPATRRAQADLARAYGVSAFAYYHYWFHGRRLLEGPYEEVLASGEPDFPFCLCWANEPWTRAWSDREGEVLVEQTYSEVDDLEHARYLARAFGDPRYVRVAGRPLFLVYRASKLASPRRFASSLRAECLRQGVGDPLLCRVESDPWRERFSQPATLGFDAAVEFSPDWLALEGSGPPRNGSDERAPVPIVRRTPLDDRVYAYADVARAAVAVEPPTYRRFRCVAPGWDNSPRRARGAVVLDGSTPEHFRRWLAETLRAALREHPPGERLVFVNAWNEWGEGCYLEPDRRQGRAWLEAVAGAFAESVGREPFDVPAQFDDGIGALDEAATGALGSLANRPALEPPTVLAASEAESVVAACDGDERRTAPPLAASVSRFASLATAARLGLAAARLEARAGVRRALAGRAAPPQRAPPPTTRLPATARPSVLFVAPYSIYPPRSGGSVRHWNLLQRIAHDFDVHVAVFSTTRDDRLQRDALESICRTVHFLEREDAGPARSDSLLPRSAELFDFPRARRALVDLAHSLRVDVVQLEHTELGQFAPLFEGRSVALSELDLTFVTSSLRQQLGFEKRYETDRVLWRRAADRRRQLRYEIGVCERVDQVHVMSDLDAERLGLYLYDRNRRLRVVPNGADCSRFGGTAEEPDSTHDCLFIGSFGHTPNRDAVEWLLAEIWPRVRAAMPAAKLAIVGAHPPPDLLAWQGRDGVDVIGAVDDVVPWYRRCRLLLAPVRAGSGTRLKLLEAFAAHLPVVATPLAAEGLDASAGEHFAVAETAEALAAATVRLLAEPTTRQRLADAALARARERFDWSHSADRLASAWEDLAAQRPLQRRSPAIVSSAVDGAEVSVILPTKSGGDLLRRTVDGVLAQVVDFSFEIVCVDSGSPAADLDWLRDRGARVHSIDSRSFNHGLTRDLGASLARGQVLVFLNQDAVPADLLWLHYLTAPLRRPGRYAAVQGGIREWPPPHRIFYWHTGGPRFYFTRESEDWIARHGALGFSTVNAAIRRDVWRRHPFGWAPILEDKKWQARITRAGLEIVAEERAAVYHSHDYDLRGLWRRCRSEGYGWRLLGETYPFAAVRADLRHGPTWRRWREGLRDGSLRRISEICFPLVRPLALFVGNRWATSSSN